MKPLPLPVRIAAGLVATAVDQAKDLPRLVAEFPVTAVSQALQASMRVQQKVTELAIKGDRALGTLRPVEEKPAWATFDDEDELPRRNGASTVTELRPQPPTRTPVAKPPAPPAPRTPAAENPAAPSPTTENPTTENPTVKSPAATAPGAGSDATAADVATGIAEATSADVATDGAGDEAAAGPNALPGYAELTIPQLRGRLRHLGLDDLRALLAWETEHENRAPYVTMLANRITTVSES
jgi:hypothetical protein